MAIYNFWDVVPDTYVGAGDTDDVTLGNRFTVPETCDVIKFRFYKNASMPAGTRIGALYRSDTQALLASETFIETASGWQEVSLSAPVTLTPGIEYIAATYHPGGHYTYYLDYYVSPPVDPFFTKTASRYFYGTGLSYPNASYGDNAYSAGVVVETPSNEIIVTPDAAFIRITPYQPSISFAGQLIVQPTASPLVLQSYSPSIVKTGQLIAQPSASPLALQSYSPSVVKVGQLIAQPSASLLALQSYSPSVVKAGQLVVQPTASIFSAQGYQPAVKKGGLIIAQPSASQLAWMADRPRRAGGVLIAQPKTSIAGFAVSTSLQAGSPRNRIITENDDFLITENGDYLSLNPFSSEGPRGVRVITEEGHYLVTEGGDYLVTNNEASGIVVTPSPSLLGGRSIRPIVRRGLTASANPSLLGIRSNQPAVLLGQVFSPEREASLGVRPVQPRRVLVRPVAPGLSQIGIQTKTHTVLIGNILSPNLPAQFGIQPKTHRLLLVRPVVPGVSQIGIIAQTPSRKLMGAYNPLPSQLGMRIHKPVISIRPDSIPAYPSRFGMHGLQPSVLFSVDLNYISPERIMQIRTPLRYMRIDEGIN